MDTNRIKEILERFYDGTSTTEEEAELMNSIDGAADMPEDIKKDLALFHSIAKAKGSFEKSIESISVPDNLEARLLKNVDKWEAEEIDRQLTAVQEDGIEPSLDTQEQPPRQTAVKAQRIISMPKRASFWIRNIAAAIIAICTIGVYLTNRNSYDKEELCERDTFTNPDEAYNATEKAFSKFAKTLAKSEQSVDDASEHINNVMDLLDKYIQ